jgi:hypothetical protein
MVYAGLREKGFLAPEDMIPDLHLCLVLTEVGEVVEAMRRGSYLDLERLKNFLDDEHELGATPEEYCVRGYTMHVKGTVEEEIVDIQVRLLGLLGYLLDKFGIEEQAIDNIRKLGILMEKQVPFSRNYLKFTVADLSSFMLSITRQLIDLNIVPISRTSAIAQINGFCKLIDNISTNMEGYFPITKVFEIKHWYNQTRPNKHGRLF